MTRAITQSRFAKAPASSSAWRWRDERSQIKPAILAVPHLASILDAVGFRFRALG